MSPTGTNAIVTGGAGELGKAVVEEFVRVGMKVSVPLRTDTTQLPGIAFSARCDLTQESDTHLFVESAEKRVGPTDILVCLAGGYIGGSLVEETSDEEILDQFRMNFLTTHHAVKMVLPGMKQRRNGRIVTTAAMPVLTPTGRREAYAVSKGAVATLTQTLGQELKGTGVTCNAIAPSIIATDPNKKSMPDADVSRWVQPAEIASLILFLTSREAGSVSGNIIRIFGGV